MIARLDRYCILQSPRITGAFSSSCRRSRVHRTLTPAGRSGRRRKQSATFYATRSHCWMHTLPSLLRYTCINNVYSCTAHTTPPPPPPLAHHSSAGRMHKMCVHTCTHENKPHAHTAIVSFYYFVHHNVSTCVRRISYLAPRPTESDDAVAANANNPHVPFTANDGPIKIVTPAPQSHFTRT